jgi:hypothetical protein
MTDINRHDDSGAWVMRAISHGADAVSHAIAGEPPNCFSEEELVAIFQRWFEMALTDDYWGLGEKQRAPLTNPDDVFGPVIGAAP